MASDREPCPHGLIIACGRCFAESVARRAEERACREPGPPPAPASPPERTGEPRRWYIEARVGGHNFRGDVVRFVRDRRGDPTLQSGESSYTNEAAEDAMAAALARAEAAEGEAEALRAEIEDLRGRSYFDAMTRAESALSALREGLQRIRILATNGNPMDPTKAALAFGAIDDMARALLGGGDAGKGEG